MNAIPSQNNRPPINVARLCDTFGDDTEFVAEMYGIYVEDAAKRLADLDSALAADDSEKVNSAAHALKGASGNIGAERMSALAAELEPVDIAEDPQQAQDLARALCTEFEAVQAFVEQFDHSPL